MFKSLRYLFLVLGLMCFSTLAFGETEATPTPDQVPVVTTTSSIGAVPDVANDNPLPAPTPAPSITPPPDITSIVNAKPGTFLDSIKNAFSSKLWGVLIGYALMLVVYLIVTFVWSDFPANWLPHMSIVIGVLGNVGWELSIGGKPWWQAILAGLTTGLSAIGAWEYPKVGGKALLGSTSNKQAIKKAMQAASPTGGAV